MCNRFMIPISESKSTGSKSNSSSNCSSINHDINSTSSSAINNKKKGKKNILCVTIIGPDDVLLGRGATIDNNPGNVKFRTLIQIQKDAYVACTRHQYKKDIAHLICTIIQNLGGKFLRKIDSIIDLVQLGYHKNDDVWEVADEITVQLKIKQALRDTRKVPRDIYKKRTTSIAAAAVPSSTTDSRFLDDVPREVQYQQQQHSSQQQQQQFQLQSSQQEDDTTAPTDFISYISSRPSTPLYNFGQTVTAPTAGRAIAAGSTNTQLQNVLNTLVATQVSNYILDMKKMEEERQLKVWIQNQLRTAADAVATAAQSPPSLPSSRRTTNNLSYMLALHDTNNLLLKYNDSICSNNSSYNTNSQSAQQLQQLQHQLQSSMSNASYPRINSINHNNNNNNNNKTSNININNFFDLLKDL